MYRKFDNYYTYLKGAANYPDFENSWGNLAAPRLLPPRRKNEIPV